MYYRLIWVRKCGRKYKIRIVILSVIVIEVILSEGYLCEGWGIYECELWEIYGIREE